MRIVTSQCFFVFVIAAILIKHAPVQGDSPRYLFGEASPVEQIRWPSEDVDAPFLSADGLEFYFEKYQGGDDWDIYVARRDSTNASFGEPVPVAELNEPSSYDGFPRLSADGLTIYMAKGSTSYFEIYSATRSSPKDPFNAPTPLFALLPDAVTGSPSVTRDGLLLYAGYRAIPPDSDVDIYSSNRDSSDKPWGPLTPVSELNDPNVSQGRPFISADGLTILYSPFDETAVDRGGGDLGLLVRSSVNSPWSGPVNLGDSINSETLDDYASLTADGRTLYFSRDNHEIWQAPVLPFESVRLVGSGGQYTQDFNGLGSDSTQAHTSLPSGWTFTANDIIFNDTTTRAFPSTTEPYAGAFNGGTNGAADRTLVTDVTRDESGELDLRVGVESSAVQALRLGFDIEAWQLRNGLGANPGEAAFHVVLEADSGNGFQQVADLGEFSTGKTLARPAAGNLVDGNDGAYRHRVDINPIDLDTPVAAGAKLRIRWIGTAGSRNVVFGLDNVSLRFAAPGDANIDGVFNSADLIDVLANGEYEDNVLGNSTWSEGDWTNDNEFDSGDLVAALASGGYVEAAVPASVPEPTGATLLLGGSTIALRAWRSKKVKAQTE